MFHNNVAIRCIVNVSDVETLGSEDEKDETREKFLAFVPMCVVSVGNVIRVMGVS